MALEAVRRTAKYEVALMEVWGSLTRQPEENAMRIQRVRDVLGIGACTLVVLGLTAGPAMGAYCYECVNAVGGGNYMDCIHPVATGHVSCIPYQATCSVGGQCGGVKTFQDRLIAPDGSVGPQQVLASDFDTSGVARDCLGLIVARSYGLARMSQLRLTTGEIDI